MKKLTLILFALLTLCGVGRVSAEDFSGKLFAVGSKATMLETGKWYFLYNNNTKKFAAENDSRYLKQVTSPAGCEAAGNEGYIFRLSISEQSEDKYYIETGLGHFVPNPGTSEKPTVDAGYPMTISPIADNEGHYTIAGAVYKLGVESNSDRVLGKSSTAAGGVCDWTFYEANFTDLGDLQGRQLFNYQMKKLGLVRLYNKRVTNYLTTTAAGSAAGAAKASNGFSQIWVVEKNGEGYLLRSAETGEFLQSDYSAPGSGKQTLYIQYSPNNTNTAKDIWCNISSESDYSGKSCLNLGQDGKTLYEWTYAGDAGCDWAIELVTEYTEQDVRDHLNEGSDWVEALEDGAYYRIVSPAYSKDMTEVDGVLMSLLRDETRLAQCWQAVENTGGWAFQNVVSQNYANGSAGTSLPFKTGKTSQTFVVTSTGDKWSNTFTIRTSASASQGMHTASSQGYQVVLWSTATEASYWAFEKVELTPEEIEAARADQSAYEKLVKNLATYQKTLDNLFEDKACTQLKESILALTDEQLNDMTDFAAMPEEIRNMVLKVKNNTWQQYENNGYSRGLEEFFRVHDYQIYSNYNSICWETGMSNCYGKLSNPTGIVANAGDVVYVYVDAAPQSECTLQLERVSTEGVPGNHQTGSTTDLKAGLNVYRADAQCMLYIFYQLNNTKKKLADYPNIRIHIEGGQLHGYWDATRGMTNDDWALLQKHMLDKCDNINLKTKRLVHAVNGAELLKACPKEIQGVTDIWETILETEESYMGLEDFEPYCNNIWNCFSVNYNYMFASSFGTYYNENTMSAIYDYNNLTTSAGSLWGPSHEIGHNHQSTINVVGAMEVSNNLFSNINVWEQGISDTRGYNVEEHFRELSEGKAWNQRAQVFSQTRMYFQLYLYFHVMKNDTTFYPRLFQALRADGMSKGNWDSSLHATSGDEEINGGYKTYARDNYLKFAKKCCDVAQADLSEFFESYGFFVPLNDHYVGDYANYFVTNTQADIDAARKYMQKYPKKLGNIMFINDFVEQKAAEPSERWHTSMPSDGLRKRYESSSTRYQGKANAGGDFTDYDGHTSYDDDGDYYTLSGSEITFRGKGWMGHKFYDKETGALIWATQLKKATLPSALRSLGAGNYVVVAAEENGEDVPCPYYKLGSMPVYEYEVAFGTQEEQRKWYSSAEGLESYLPVNAVAVLTDTKTVPEDLKTQTNVVRDGVAQQMVIDGDAPFQMPTEATAQHLTFSKKGAGYQALSLPFALNDATTLTGSPLVMDRADVVAAGAPVVMQGDVSVEVNDVALVPFKTAAQDEAFVLGADGTAVVAGQATPFVYTFDSAQPVTIATSVHSLDATTSADAPLYDLQGRRVNPSHATPGIYVRAGRKITVGR